MWQKNFLVLTKKLIVVFSALKALVRSSHTAHECEYFIAFWTLLPS